VALGRGGVTVALDGYGAEQGFDILAEGARLAAADGIKVRVFGPERSLDLDGVDGIEVVPTNDWIANDEDPVPAVRSSRYRGSTHDQPRNAQNTA
jgi:fatty acid/phospholipid biosynthesis enzyme